MTTRTCLFGLNILILLWLAELAIGQERSAHSRSSSSSSMHYAETIDSLNIHPETRTRLKKHLQKARKQSASQALIFVGPNQKGKRETAKAFAFEYQHPLLTIDVQNVTSQYIGETEKNIDGLFRKAKTQQAILFFDEADALFGKRAGVTSTHDRYANQEVSYLLQRIRQYPGLMIFSTQDIPSSRLAQITKKLSIMTFYCKHPTECAR